MSGSPEWHVPKVDIYARGQRECMLVRFALVRAFLFVVCAPICFDGLSSHENRIAKVARSSWFHDRWVAARVPDPQKWVIRASARGFARIDT